MFTGIIEELGSVLSLERQPAGARLVIACEAVLSDAAMGCSIAVNGVCLTAFDLTKNSFAADLAPETLARTNLEDQLFGARVNLERSVTTATRLSGHIVQGHVDTTAECLSIETLGDGNYWLQLRIPAEYDRYLVHKGSLTVDGISLTIASLDQDAAGDAILGITVIPHTYSHTTLGLAKPGSRLNIEVDVLAKHVEKLLRITR